MKYYVVYEEGDAELSEDEECERHQDVEDPGNIPNNWLTCDRFQNCSSIVCRQPQEAENAVNFKRVGKPRPADNSDGNESDQEGKAEQVNTGLKEPHSFCQSLE